MYRCNIQLFTKEWMEAIWVWDLDRIKFVPIILGMVNPGLVSGRDVSPVCGNSYVWIRES
jgi:hypothetical protein